MTDTEDPLGQQGNLDSNGNTKLQGHAVRSEWHSSSEVLMWMTRKPPEFHTLQGWFVIMNVDSCKQRSPRAPFRFTDSSRKPPAHTHTVHMTMKVKHAQFYLRRCSLKCQSLGVCFVLRYTQENSLKIPTLHWGNLTQWVTNCPHFSQQGFALLAVIVC